MKLLKKKEKYKPIQGLVSEATDYNVYHETKRERFLWFLTGLLAGGGLLHRAACAGTHFSPSFFLFLPSFMKALTFGFPQ